MIEPIMFVGIGFLIAGLLVIGVIPLVHARAVRLTTRRLEALTPLSMAEIQADKDQLRAEFAMSTRRLEMNVEQMKAKLTSQLAEIGKKSEAVGRLRLELGEKTAALLALEAREKQMAEELQAVQTDLAAKVSGLEEAERALASTQAEHAQVSAKFIESSTTTHSQRVELVALRAQNEALAAQIDTLGKENKELRGRATREAAAGEALNRQLTDERGKSEQLGNRIGELERQLVAQTTEREILGRRIEELNARIDEQGRLLTERQSTSDGLRKEAAAGQKREADLRAEMAAAESRHRLAMEALRAEKKSAEDQLGRWQDERARLQREVASMKHEAEVASASEQSENSALRERIAEVAAEVARLTATLEGPDSPISTILAAEGAGSASVANETNGIPPLAPSGGESKVTLADRIRALQGRASRVAQPSTL